MDIVQTIKTEIARLQGALRVLEGGAMPMYAAPSAESTGVVVARAKRGPKPGTHRVMSEEAKQRIREGQARRWATQRASKGEPVAPAAVPAIAPTPELELPEAQPEQTPAPTDAGMQNLLASVEAGKKRSRRATL